MKLAYTRAMITAALKGDFNHIAFEADPVFGLCIPVGCPNVPAEILNPRNTWADVREYDKKANELALAFVHNLSSLRPMQVKKCSLPFLKLLKTHFKSIFFSKNLHFNFFLVLIAKDCLFKGQSFLIMHDYVKGNTRGNDIANDNLIWNLNQNYKFVIATIVYNGRCVYY